MWELQTPFERQNVIPFGNFWVGKHTLFFFAFSYCVCACKFVCVVKANAVQEMRDCQSWDPTGRQEHAERR